MGDGRVENWHFSSQRVPNDWGLNRKKYFRKTSGLKGGKRKVATILKGHRGRGGKKDLTETDTGRNYFYCNLPNLKGGERGGLGGSVSEEIQG